jgi:hypothetical protein
MNKKLGEIEKAKTKPVRTLRSRSRRGGVFAAGGLLK